MIIQLAVEDFEKLDRLLKSESLSVTGKLSLVWETALAELENETPGPLMALAMALEAARCDNRNVDLE